MRFAILPTSTSGTIVSLWNENKIMSVSSGHLTIKLSNFLIDIIKIAECFVYKI